MSQNIGIFLKNIIKNPINSIEKTINKYTSLYSE